MLNKKFKNGGEKVRKALIGLAICLCIGLLVPHLALAAGSATIDAIYDGDTSGVGYDWGEPANDPYVPVFLIGNDYTGRGYVDAEGNSYTDNAAAAIYIDWTHSVNDADNGWENMDILPVWSGSLTYDSTDELWRGQWGFLAGAGIDPSAWTYGMTTALVVTEGASTYVPNLSGTSAADALRAMGNTYGPDDYKIYAIYQGETGTSAVPEPTTMILLGSGLIGLAAFRRKRA